MGQFEDRKVYAKGELGDAPEHPAVWLKSWLEEAKAADPEDYNAMTLSTVGLDGHPDARMVLLREVEWDAHGFVFYTNYRSEKGQQLSAHPHASLTFFWPQLERQLRVRGRVETLPEEQSDRYFLSRPRASRVGAWASEQSQSVLDRAALELARERVEKEHPGEVPRPPHWGGYRLMASALEFWQGRPGRLHDRFRYERVGEDWVKSRLQP